MTIGIDYIGVSAGVVIFKDNKVFMALRSNKARDDQGKWEFPGGSVNFNESRKQASQRNIKDKYNIEFNIRQILDVYDVIDPENKDHWLSTTFLGDFVSGEPSIVYPDKSEQIGWFSLNQVKNMNISRITKLNLKSLDKLCLC